MASHNHSPPHYTSGGAGVWLFQDVADLRAFEYAARQLTLAAQSVGDRWVAATRLRPGDTAYVPAGGLTDAFGETNGSPIPLVPPPLEE